MAQFSVPVFSRADHELLKQTQRKIHDLLPVLDDAEDCGLECSTLRELLNQEAGRLTEIERAFMTPVPER